MGTLYEIHVFIDVSTDFALAETQFAHEDELLAVLERRRAN
jgi:hypothetical protein